MCLQAVQNKEYKKTPGDFRLQLSYSLGCLHFCLNYRIRSDQVETAEMSSTYSYVHTQIKMELFYDGQKSKRKSPVLLPGRG